MQLIGMLDSPYVRRTAISLHMLDLPFEHRSISVFRQWDTFVQIHPVVKAPTLVCDDGVTLIDSSLIIDYAESIAGRSLMPADRSARRAALHWVGLGLVGAEKAVQVYYEGNRPAERQSQDWLNRVTGQLQAAWSAMEEELAALDSPWLLGDQPGQPDITVGTAWGFTQLVCAPLIPSGRYPRLTAFAARAEALPAFRAWPLPAE